MDITRHGDKITLTDNELTKAYREQVHNYHLMDAESQFYDYIGIIPDDCDEDGELNEPGQNQLFTDTYGFSFDEAVNPTSEHYLLEKIVSEFERKFDCDSSINDMWQWAVGCVLTKEKH